MTTNGKCRLRLLSLSATVTLIACSAAASAPPTTSPPMSGCVITDVSIIDVEKGTAVPGQTVVVIGELIDKVGAQAGSRTPENALIIDGHGLYLMPGLVDAHVHYFDPPGFGRLMIANGVLLVRDMGQATEEVLKLRAALNRGELLGPEMLATGSILDGDPPSVPPISIGLKTPSEGRAAVRKQVEAGVDQIKVYSRLEKDVFLAVVDEAQRHGLSLVGHIPESIYIEEAAKAGQRSCEHLFGFEKMIGRLLSEPVTLTTGGMGSDVHYWLRLPEVKRSELRIALHRIRDSKMSVCPTVVVFRNGSRRDDVESGKYPMLEYVSPTIRNIWTTVWPASQQNSEMADKVWPHMQAFVRELHEAGVTLMVGTDLLFPGIIPGHSVHEEMALWQDAGIPPADVLRSATIVPTRFMGLDKQFGTVAQGKTASMVLVRANPLQDIRNAKQIEGVFLRGQFFGRDDLGRFLDEAKDLARDHRLP